MRRPIRRVRVFIVVTAAALIGVSAAVARADTGPLLITDPCGDAATMVQANDHTADAPPDGRTPGFDIQSAQVTNLYQDVTPIGIRITLTMCGAIPAPELPSAFWNISASFNDTCNVYLEVADSVPQGSPQTGVMRNSQVYATCVEPGSTSVTEVWHYPVAATIDGSTITWQLLRASVPSDVAETLQPGTTWKQVHVKTKDGRQNLLYTSSGDNGTYYAGTPGGHDDADGGDFTVA